MEAKEYTKTVTDFKMKLKEFSHRRGILEAILYFATSGDNCTLPTIAELIHREVIDATVEYATGKESKYQPPGMDLPSGRGPDGKILYKWHHDIKLEQHMWDYLQKELESDGQKLGSNTKKELVEMLEPHWKSDEWGDGEYEPETHLHFKGFAGGGICDALMRSTFFLSQKTIHHVKNEVLPSLSESEKNDVEQIGKAMQKYISRDLKYIRERYQW